MVQCLLCPHTCRIPEGAAGICGTRRNADGKLIAESYGKITSLALDPIEKKPLRRFRPGSLILSVGSYGCNLRCSFCQNDEISMGCPPTRGMTPRELVETATALKNRGNIGIAFTYNEPLIGYEFVLESAKLAREQGMCAVLVTNGYICESPLLELLPFVDAMNIDLKAFCEDTYRWLGGGMEEVKHTIRLAAARCHVEVTTLIIPGRNDAPEEIDALAAWLASVNRDIPLHISRFFPHYRLTHIHPTPVERIQMLAGVARKHLSHVYTGNC